MNKRTPYSSIASMGQDAGAIVATHLERTFRHVLRGPGTENDPRFIRLITGEPHPFGNLALVSDPADLKGTELAIQPLLDCGAPSAVIFSGAIAPDIVNRLRNAGFEPHGAMPAMAVETKSMSPAVLPSGYSLDRVGGGAEADEWAEAFALGYELPHRVGEAFSPNMARATTAPDAPIQYFAIRKQRRIVCTSVLSLDNGVAGVYCVATVPDERGKGLGGHATVEPLRLVRGLGYGVGVLQSSAAGFTLYQKLGFRSIGEVPLFVRMPAIESHR